MFDGSLVQAQFAAPEPIGTVLIVSTAARLVAVDFGAQEERLQRLLYARFGAGVRLKTGDPHGGADAIASYFAGDMAALDRLPIDGGGSPFQRQVWAALRAIAPGETRSYGWIAAHLGRPGAARAVGLANALNPINLVVPCHRVVGASGALTGYGGGLARKRWLLDFERRACDAGRPGVVATVAA